MSRVLTVPVAVRKRFGNEWTDVRDFIRPRDFMVRNVLASRSSWSVVDAWRWVIENIHYPEGEGGLVDQHTVSAYQPCSGLLCAVVGALVPKRRYSTMDFWNFPAETLRDGIGDCEDSAFLLTSMLRSLYPDMPVYATVGFFDEFGHVWTSVNQSGNWLILDTTLPRLPSTIPDERTVTRYRPIFRVNEEEVLVETDEFIVPERMHTLGKDIRVRSWYVIGGHING